MRRISAMAAILLFSATGAGAAGDPVGCAEIVFLEPDLQCQDAPLQGNLDFFVNGSVAGADADGQIWTWNKAEAELSTCGPAAVFRYSLQRLDPLTGMVTTVATVDDRCGSEDPLLYERGQPGTILVDLVSGRLVTVFIAECIGGSPESPTIGGGECDYGVEFVVFSMDGLTTLADVLELSDGDDDSDSEDDDDSDDEGTQAEERNVRDLDRRR